VKEDDMTHPTSPAEAQVALDGVAWAREQVIGQIGMPWWYWWGLAACWVGLGVMSDLGVSAWILTAATVAVGAVHSAVFNRLLAGRAGSGVQVRRSVAGRHSELRVIGFLLVLVALTVVSALLLDWDGAGHPGTWSGIFTATVLLLGGPRVMAWIRRDASR
jgi:hypothetical protein